MSTEETRTRLFADEGDPDAWSGDAGEDIDPDAYPNRMSYDLEIARPLPMNSKGKADFDRVTECGASVIVTWGIQELTPTIHLPETVPIQDTLGKSLEACDGILSWNGAHFDDRCVNALWDEWYDKVAQTQHIDLMAILGLLTLDVPASELEGGVPGNWQEIFGTPQTRRQPWRLFKGLKLDVICKENLGVGKTEGIDGALAAEIWKKRPDLVISYCISDVALVNQLYKRAWDQGFLEVPARGGRVEIPHEVL